MSDSLRSMQKVTWDDCGTFASAHVRLLNSLDLGLLLTQRGTCWCHFPSWHGTSGNISPEQPSLWLCIPGAQQSAHVPALHPYDRYGGRLFGAMWSER